MSEFGGARNRIVLNLFSGIESSPSFMSSFTKTSEFSTSRQRMVDSQLRSRGVTDELVLEAMSRVPREAFVPEHYRGQSYEDHPLPIGEGQTISQPYIVALMLAALNLAPNDRVLEVGTGSGYVTALLAELTAQVCSVERHPALADAARDLLAGMGYSNVKVIVGDGCLGFREQAPYDAIIVSATAPQVPPALIEQLAEGGRMMIPVGADDSQQLQLIRMEGGQPRITLREHCRFVPLVPGDRS
jgi:protein-L-isoaspartate(D-aspartate) O-methyltransferase